MNDLDTPPREHVVRLLWPFLYRRGDVAQARECLAALRHPAAKRDWPCWDPCESGASADADSSSETGIKPHTMYQEETLPGVGGFLFGGGPGGCGYLRVPDDTASHWFGRSLTLAPGAGRTVPRGNNRTAAFRVRLSTDPGIEVFLSPHGAGVLSVALTADPDTALPVLQDFNYRLSQARPFVAWEVQLPPGDDPRAPAPPDRKAPLVERLGRRGGAFHLVEWVRFLLGPLADLDYQPLQNQFSVYSVTRLGPAADFSDSAVTAALLPALTALAHVEEHGHAGSRKVTEQVLNARHWAAVGSLAAAHLVADQDPPVHYNDQRVTRVLCRYFTPHLIGLLQRTALQHLLREARAALVAGDEVGAGTDGRAADQAAALRRLNQWSLALTLNGTFTEVSTREVINQYFQLTQAGLRLTESMGAVQRALRDAEAIEGTRQQLEQGRFQAETLGELKTLAGRLEDLVSEAGRHAHLVAHVQSKVEWLEVFFVSYYFTALMYYVSHSGLFVHDYATWSLIAAPFVSGGIALLGLKPYKLDEETAPAQARQAPGEKPTASKQKSHSWVFLVVLVLTFVAWLAIGLTFFPGCKDQHECKPVSAAEPTATAPAH